MATQVKFPPARPVEHNGDVTLGSAFLHAFVALFVAVDAIGIAPIYAALTRTLSPRDRDAVLASSVLVAAAVSVSFALLGKAVFLFLGITVADFQIAGGLILIALAGLDLLGTEPRGLAEGRDAGIVPIAVPLIAGPAVITSTIVLVDLYGPLATVLALLANLATCWVVLARIAVVEGLLGRTGARALSKIISLLLAAIGVRLVRQGLRG
jgi:multiple antibiotic resistance protein